MNSQIDIKVDVLNDKCKNCPYLNIRDEKFYEDGKVFKINFYCSKIYECNELRERWKNENS